MAVLAASSGDRRVRQPCARSVTGRTVADDRHTSDGSSCDLERLRRHIVHRVSGASRCLRFERVAYAGIDGVWYDRNTDEK
jgi:hypothetical protein